MFKKKSSKIYEELKSNTITLIDLITIAFIFALGAFMYNQTSRKQSETIIQNINEKSDYVSHTLNNIVENKITQLKNINLHIDSLEKRFNQHEPLLLIQYLNINGKQLKSKTKESINSKQLKPLYQDIQIQLKELKKRSVQISSIFTISERQHIFYIITKHKVQKKLLGYTIGFFELEALLKKHIPLFIKDKFNIVIKEKNQIIYQSTQNEISKIVKSTPNIIKGTNWQFFLYPKYILSITFNQVLQQFIIFFMIIFALLTYISYRLWQQSKKTLEKKQISEEKNLLLLHSVDEGILGVNISGEISFLNPAAEKILGWTLKEVYYKSVYELLQHSYQDNTPYPIEKSNIYQASKDGKTRECHTEFFWKKDKSCIPVKYKIAPVIRNNQIIGLVLIFQDISDLIANEKKYQETQEQLLQAQKSEAIGQLAGGIAHEFNNILQSISGYTQLLEIKLSKEKKIPELDTIKQCVFRSADLIQGLLAYARKSKYKEKLIDVNEVIKETLKIVQPTLGRAIRIKTELYANLPYIKGDFSQLEQVIMNLCINAKDAISSEGKINIISKVEKDASDPEKTWVKISISDNGHGISKELMKKIFEPFFTTKEVGKGTGLGLSMAFGTIENHRGYINVESTENVGTTFHLYLPTLKDNVVSQIGKKEEKSKDFSSLQGTSCLIIDDDNFIIEYIECLLSSMDINVHTLIDGNEAIATLREHPVNYVILDLIMPKISGIRVYHMIREVFQTLPIVIASGYSETDEITEILKEDPKVDFIQKPYESDALFTKILEILDKKENDIVTFHPK